MSVPRSGRTGRAKDATYRAGKKCFVADCSEPVNLDGRYCQPHARAMSAWLSEERRLDNEAEGRRERQVDWENGWLEVHEPVMPVWDDPEELVEELVSA